MGSPQEPRPIAENQREDSRRRDPALTTKRIGLSLILKEVRVRLVPQKSGPKAEGTASHFTFKYPTSKPTVVEQSALLGRCGNMRSLGYDGA